MKQFISIIIPTPKINKYIKQNLIPALEKQTCQNFELIISTSDKKNCKFPKFVKIIKTKKSDNPALARDIATKIAKGNIYAFIDDDCYPSENWCKKINKYINKPNIAAICGPGLTPPQNNLFQKTSGFMWTTSLAAGGAGTYRCEIKPNRFVDDFPTFNLIVKKQDFDKVGGFNSNFWPGEDTKLCHDLVYKLNKLILYHPEIIVYHHRRPIFMPHLKQISRYGFQRGRFTKLFPKTSNKLVYYIPSLFLIYLLSLLFIYFFKITLSFSNEGLIINYLINLPLYLYLFFLFLTTIQVLAKSRNFLIGFLQIPTIILSHLTYGFFFLKGILYSKKNKVSTKSKLN